MNYPPPPPPPPASEEYRGTVRHEEGLQYTDKPILPASAIEMAQHQAAQIDWGVEHGYYAELPSPPAPVAAVPLPPPPQPAPSQFALPLAVQKQGPKINVRNKGQRGEREVVKLLQAVVDVVRTRKGLGPIVLQRNVLQAHLGGEDIFGLEGFSVEVKFQENENVGAWWRQAVAQAELRSKSGQHHVPVLFYRASRAKWTVRFRAFVSTPGDRDQIEMDLETNVEDFVEWFGNAYDERVSTL